MAHSLNILNEGLDSLFESVKECCICGKLIEGEGNNAEPVCDGECCDECNMTVVVPERLKRMKEQHKSLGEAEEQMSKNEKTGATIGTVAGGVDGAITGQIIGKAAPKVASKIAGTAVGKAVGAKVAGTAVGKAVGTAIGVATPWIGDEAIMGAVGAGVGTAIGAIAGRKSGKKIGKELDNVESENNSVTEDFDTAKPNHELLLSILRKGLVSYEEVCLDCLCEMRDDEIADMMHEWGLDEYVDELGADIEEESLTEAVGTPGTEKIYGMIEDGLLTAEQVVDMCLRCMSEDDIQWMIHNNELDIVEESLEEADDEHEETEHEETEQEKRQREIREKDQKWMDGMRWELAHNKVWV